MPVRGRPRFGSCMAAGAFGGAALGCTMVLFDAVTTSGGAAGGAAAPHLPEIVLLKLLGSVPELTFRPAFFLVPHRGYLYLVPILLLLLLRPSRRPAVWALCAALWVLGFMAAALACGAAYAFDHTWGVLPGPI